MQMFFTGCTHFGHAKIIDLAKRPFASVEEMDEVMIERWNAVVRPEDRVYHLGDFSHKAKGNYSVYDYLRKLNGEKVMIRGNHDPATWGPDYMEIDDPARKIVLMHYPIEEWNGWYRNAIHLHCHTHSRELVSAPRRFNVGVDATYFTPVSIDELLAHPNARETWVTKAKRFSPT